VIRVVLGLAALASEVVLIYRGDWLIAGLTGACVVLVMVLAPVAAEFRDIWAEVAARMRRTPEPAPPPPLTQVSPGTGEGYECARCGGPGETDWASPSARAARSAGVCGECFGALLGTLSDCRSADEDPTMRVAAGGRHERVNADPVDDPDDTYPSMIGHM
jgi:hypothetical protein